MRKNIFVLILLITGLISCLFVIDADVLKINEIAANNTKLRHKELIIAGEISSITHRETMGLYIENMNKLNNDNSNKKELGTDIYFVNDETAGIYVLTTKHYDEKQQVTFKTQVLMNSEDKVGNGQVMLYDKYIAAKTGFSSPSYSKYMLENLLEEAPQEKPWVLLIDIE